MTLEELRVELVKKNIVLTDEMLRQFNEYARYLIEYNEKINLTAINKYEEIIDKHFYDSLLFVDKPLQGTIVDVGSGAGFPGVVLKIAFPELRVILLEPINKRCIFLNSLIDLLKLKDIVVINDRGEDYSLKHREEYDYVTARAVTNLNNLIEICGALVKLDGYFICLRGSNGEEELENASRAIMTMGFEVKKKKTEYLFSKDVRKIAYLQKIKKTPTKYPRKFNIIKRNPL